MNEPLYEDSGPDINIRDMLALLFKHKIKIIVFFIVVSVVAFLYVLGMPDMYSSEASLLVQAGREDINIIPSANTDNAISVSRSQEYDVNNAIELLRSPEIYEALVDSINFRDLLPEKMQQAVAVNKELSEDIKADIIKNIRENIQISNPRYTNIIIIKFVTNNPYLSQHIVSTMINIFLQKHLEINFSNSQYNFFLNQVNTTKAQLDSVEKAISELNKQFKTGSIENYTEQQSVRRAALLQERDTNSAAIAASRSKIAFLTNKLNTVPQSSGDAMAAGNTNLQEQLTALVTREQELTLKYSPDNSQVKEVQRQISELQARIKNSIKSETATTQDIQQIQQDLLSEQTNLESLTARNKEIENLLGEIDADASVIDENYGEITNLQRRRALLLEMYQKYSSTLEETKIDQIVQQDKISGIRVQQPATFNRRPEDSKKMKILAIGILFGMLGGVFWAVVGEFLNHTIKKQNDIEKFLGLRTLVVIPYQNKTRIK